jgi:hypothetical protein
MPVKKILRRDLAVLSDRAGQCAPFLASLVLVSCVFMPPHWPSLVAAIGLGVAAFALAVVSWHVYHPWLTWTIWILPASAGFAAIVGYYAASGEATAFNVLFQATWAGIATFLLLAAKLRRQLLQWVA